MISTVSLACANKSDSKPCEPHAFASGCTHGLGHNKMDISIFSYICNYIFICIYIIYSHICIYAYTSLSPFLSVFLSFTPSGSPSSYLSLSTVGQIFLLKSLQNTEWLPAGQHRNLEEKNTQQKEKIMKTTNEKLYIPALSSSKLVFK